MIFLLLTLVLSACASHQGDGETTITQETQQQDDQYSMHENAAGRIR